MANADALGMTARRPIGRLFPARVLGRSCGALLLVLSVLASTGGAGAASTAIVVSADVASSTYLAIDSVGAPPNGCQTNTSNVTSFGAVSVSASAITSADCNIVWGSSNDSAMLRMYQADGYGDALQSATGGTWAAQNSTTATHLRDIDAVSEQVAWAVGDGGTVLRTTDGGSTWVVRNAGVAVALRGVKAIDANTAYVVGDATAGAGVFTRTTDGGTTWSAPAATGSNSYLYGIERTDATHMWAVGDLGRIRFSSDDGATWTAQTSNTAQPLFRVRAVDSNTLWAIGWNGTVLHTTDGGTTWIAQTNIAGITGVLRDVRVIDANNVWIAGLTGIIARTTNGGGSWTGMTSGTTDYYGISGPSINSATIVGAGGVIKTTTDSGATWTTQTSGTSNDIRAIRVIGNGTRWLAGLTGTVLKSTAPSVPNYDDDNIGSDYNWTEGANMFGACLETATNGATGGAGVGGWAVAGDNNCTTASAAWNPIAATSASSGAKVAAVTPGPTATAAVTLRFGFKTSGTQEPGVYEAPLVIQVVAPNV